MTPTVMERQIEPQPVPAMQVAAAPRHSYYIDVAAIAAIALIVRLIQLDHTPTTDELNHLLAARSLLENGTLRFTEAGEPYTRGWILTYMVAGLFRLFGESLVVARLPAVVAGTLLVVVVFLAVRVIAGRTAAWISALLVCFSPILIYQSQQVRFYSLQALFFWVGTILVYHLLTASRRDLRHAAAVAAAAAFSFILALHFQPITIVGIGAVLLWAAVPSAIELRRRFPPLSYGWMAACLILLISVIGFLVVTSAIGLFHVPFHPETSGGPLSRALDRAIGLFNYVDVWAQEEQSNFRYYHWYLLDQYATLWTLFPLAVLLAASAHPRPALLAALVFAAAFTFHSLAAWKAERYLSYAMPFFFALSGTALAEAIPWLRGRLERFVSYLPGSKSTSTSRRAIAWGLGLGAVLFAVAGNGAASYSVHMLSTSDADWDLAIPYRGEADWAAAARSLAPLVASSEVVLASSEMKALYFLGRLDFDLAPELVTQLGREAAHVGRSPKSGRPWVVDVESLHEAVACHASGLAIVETYQWRTPLGVLPSTADYLEQHARAVPVPEDWRLLVFHWQHPQLERPDECR